MQIKSFHGLKNIPEEKQTFNNPYNFTHKKNSNVSNESASILNQVLRAINVVSKSMHRVSPVIESDMARWNSRMHF